MSLFERIGGAPAIAASVELFYVKQVADEKVKGFFHHIDLEKLKAHQRDFLTMAFGGPDHYTGRSLTDSHKFLFISDWHFDSVKKNLLDTLAELKVAKALINEVEVIVESTRKAIVYQEP